MNQTKIDWIKTSSNVARILMWILVWYNILNHNYDIAMVYTLIIMAFALTDIVDTIEEAEKVVKEFREKQHKEFTNHG